MGAKAKRQLTIPGADIDSIDSIDEIAGPYTAALYERQDLQVKEGLLRTQLAERMTQLGIDDYTYRDGEARYRLTRDQLTKIKCKRVKNGDVAADEPA